MSKLILASVTLLALVVYQSAQASVVEVEVTIKNIDLESRQITVAYQTKNGQKTIDLDVSRRAEITSNGAAISLDTVKAGDQATVTYEKELQIVTKIAVNTGSSGSPKNTRRTSGQRLLEADGKPVYLHGANLPWLDGCYHNGLGVCFEHPEWRCAYNSQHLEAYLADMKRMNLNVVRVWLFENLQGLAFTKDGLVSGLEPTFDRNFADILRVAEKEKMALYLCLANDFMKTCQRLSLKDIASDPDACKAYVLNAVIPLVKKCKGRSCVFAFDIMNEPEQDIAGPTGNWTSNGIAWDTMRRFLQANADAIHRADPTRLVSCGSGWHDWKNVAAGRFDQLGLDFYDIHVHSDDGHVPPVSTLKVHKPVIIGEYGQATKHVDYDLQAKVAQRFLRNALDGGYAGTLIWRYNHPNATEEKEPVYLDLLVGRGSGEWRPVCRVLQRFLSEADVGGKTGQRATNQ
jgi:hypothetical protein